MKKWTGHDAHVDHVSVGGVDCDRDDFVTDALGRFFDSALAAATYRPRRHVEYDLLTGKIVPEDPDVFEVVHSVVVMTEDERQLPVPLERPASPLLFPLPDRADSPVSVTF